MLSIVIDQYKVLHDRRRSNSLSGGMLAISIARVPHSWTSIHPNTHIQRSRSITIFRQDRTLKMYSKSIAAAMLLALTSTAQAYVTVKLFQDNDCQTPVVGSGQTTVNSGTCDTGPFETGWSSAMIIDNTNSPAGTLTFYTRNDCAAGTSHGYSSANYACLNNFGFTANAVGLGG